VVETLGTGNCFYQSIRLNRAMTRHLAAWKMGVAARPANCSRAWLQQTRDGSLQSRAV